MVASRGGKRQGAGRKPLGYPANTEVGVLRSLRLTPAQWAALSALGGGNAAAGVRHLLSAQEVAPERPSPAATAPSGSAP